MTTNHSLKSSLSLTTLVLSLFCFAEKVHSHDHYSNYKLTETEQINETIPFDSKSDNNKITIFNVYGSVNVHGYGGDEIEITANNQVYANDATHLQQGIDEIGLKLLHIDNNIYLYLDSPFTHFEADTGDIWHSDTCWKRDDCSRKYTEKKQYKYNMNIMVKIPQNTSIKLATLKASAINGGDILIENIDAKQLNISNINGAINMSNVSGQTQAHAINKDINIVYNKNPSSASSFESINGDLNIQFAEKPDAKVIYKTMNGDLYTKYEYKTLPTEIETMTPNDNKSHGANKKGKVKNSKHNKHGNKYRITAKHPIQIGDGGPTYTFKTLNGDIKIK